MYKIPGNCDHMQWISNSSPSDSNSFNSVISKSDFSPLTVNNVHGILSLNTQLICLRSIATSNILKRINSAENMQNENSNPSYSTINQIWNISDNNHNIAFSAYNEQVDGAGPLGQGTCTEENSVWVHIISYFEVTNDGVNLSRPDHYAICHCLLFVTNPNDILSRNAILCHTMQYKSNRHPRQ